MKKKIKIGVAVVVSVLMAFIVKEGIRFNQYKSKAKATTISAIDISNVVDGKYQGEYDLDFIYASVSVVVKDNLIKEVNILHHKHERGAEAEKEVPKKIIAQQSIKVDAVSGATNSSKAIMKAVENALKNELGNI